MKPANEVDFSELFDDETFEEFICQYLTIESGNKKIFQTTKKGRDGKIDCYYNKTLNATLDKVQYDHIVQVKWFEKTKKVGVSDYRSKISNTIIDSSKEEKSYQFEGMGVKDITFVFSDDILEADFLNIPKYVKDIFDELEVADTERPDYRIVSKIDILKTMESRSSEFRELESKYSMMLFLVPFSSIKNGEILVTEITSVAKESNGVLKTIDMIFDNLTEKSRSLKTMQYYNSHVNFINFDTVFWSRHYTEEQRKKLFESIVIEAKDNYITELSRHREKHFFFESTAERTIKCIDLSDKIADIAHNKIRRGIYVNLSTEHNERQFDTEQFVWEIDNE